MAVKQSETRVFKLVQVCLMERKPCYAKKLKKIYGSDRSHLVFELDYLDDKPKLLISL